MISTRVTVYCRYRNESLNSNTIITNCTSEANIKSVLKAYWNNELPGPSDLATPEHKVDSFFVDQINQLYFDELRPPDGPASCDGYTPFDAYLTTLDEASYNKAQTVYDNLVNEIDDFVYDLELTTSDPEKEICGVYFGTKEVAVYPHYNELGTYKPDSKTIISPGVIVAEPNVPTPATTLYPGKPYIIYAYNFPEGSTVNIKLLGNTSQPVDTNYFPGYKIRNFHDSGPVPINWTLSNDFPRAKYYLQATTTGITTFSQALSVQEHGTPKRRHLFG